MTRRTKPVYDAPATIWHEAHPRRPDMPVRVCVHPRIKVTERFVYYARCCRGTTTQVSPLLRFSREELASGEWLRASVWDREDETCASRWCRVGQQFSALAWFRAGDVPSPVPRPTEWDAERRDAAKAQARYERAMDDAAARVGEWANGPAGRRSMPGMAERLGYRPDDAHRDDLTALGLTAMPDAEGLRRAWQATAKRTHPDAGGTDEAFTRAKAAHERLTQVVEHGVATGF